VTGGFDAGDVRERNAVDPFDRQDALRRPLPIDRRNTEAFVLADVVGHLGDGGRFEAKVEFEIGRALEVVDDGHGLQATDRRVDPLDQPRREIVAVEVGHEALLDARPQDLHRHLPLGAVGIDHGRLMDLGDGGRGHRRTERTEMVFEPPAEAFLDGAARLLHRKRRQPVLQVLQVGGEVRPDQIGARRQELTELDVGGAEAGDRAGDALLARLAGPEGP